MGLCTSKRASVASTSMPSEARKEAEDKRNSKDGSSQPQQPNSPRLEDTQRRRLSVSTVEHDQLGLQQYAVNKGKQGSKDESKDSESRRGQVINDNAHSDSSGSEADLTPASKQTDTGRSQQSSNDKSRIKKFSDPALELLDPKTGRVKDVTPEMVLDLVKNCSDTFLLFGSACDAGQKGFDNKKMTVLGTATSTFVPSANGIGFACKKGLKPESPNQDDFFILRADNWAMYGVFDGHGPCGHDVSGFVHKALPFLILGDKSFEADPCGVMRRCFRKVHQLVEAISETPAQAMDCTLSGTTGTVVLIRDDKLFVAHVGDSRSVMAAKSGPRLRALELTDDHKPTRPDELKRIIECGGEVRLLEGDVPHRVFVKNRLYPGLAMSRAIGDTVGAGVGVSPDPDTRVVELTADDQFVIVSSDGVWEFIKSQEAVDFVCNYRKKDVQKAADFLAYESWRRWVENEENVVDDVTCIVVWLPK